MSDLDDNEQVAEADDEQRQQEAERGRVDDEDGVPQVLGLGPVHVAGVVWVVGAGEDDHGQHHQHGRPPHQRTERKRVEGQRSLRATSVLWL